MGNYRARVEREERQSFDARLDTPWVRVPLAPGEVRRFSPSRSFRACQRLGDMAAHALVVHKE